jgi:cytochrome oxidase Cu insertion factor (SCO1/SenC/PrrC family)
MKQANLKIYSGAGPDYRRQRGFVNSRQALVLLALLFLMPVLVAYLMHMRVEHGWRPSSTTNKGTLIQPPRPLTLPADLVSATGKPVSPDLLGGKWTLVYIDDAACGEACRNKLYQMHQVRLAQGENLRRVQRLFLVTGSSDTGGLTKILADYPDMATALLSPVQAAVIAPVFSVADMPIQGAGNIYLVDPLGNLMMYYRPDADPRGIIQDLQRLLKYSHTG